MIDYYESKVKKIRAEIKTGDDPLKTIIEMGREKE